MGRPARSDDYRSLRRLACAEVRRLGLPKSYTDDCTALDGDRFRRVLTALLINFVTRAFDPNTQPVHMCRNTHTHIHAYTQQIMRAYFRNNPRTGRAPGMRPHGYHKLRMFVDIRERIVRALLCTQTHNNVFVLSTGSYHGFEHARSRNTFNQCRTGCRATFGCTNMICVIVWRLPLGARSDVARHTFILILCVFFFCYAKDIRVIFLCVCPQLRQCRIRRGCRLCNRRMCHTLQSMAMAIVHDDDKSTGTIRCGISSEYLLDARPTVGFLSRSKAKADINKHAHAYTHKYDIKPKRSYVTARICISDWRSVRTRTYPCD